jgi:hypothetical protein
MLCHAQVIRIGVEWHWRGRALRPGPSDFLRVPREGASVKQADQPAAPSGGGDWTGWLGRQDSNLCIGEFASRWLQCCRQIVPQPAGAPAHDLLPFFASHDSGRPDRARFLMRKFESCRPSQPVRSPPPDMERPLKTARFGGILQIWAGLRVRKLATEAPLRPPHRWRPAPGVPNWPIIA